MTETTLYDNLHRALYEYNDGQCPDACDGPLGIDEVCLACYTGHIEKAILQPEIDKARVEGRRQIQDIILWIHNHSVGITADNELKNNPLWQAKLKEWGLEAQE